MAVSSGSACTAGTLTPSHVLMAMGVEPGVAQGAIRSNLGRDNDVEQVDRVVRMIPAVVEPLQRIW